MELRAKWKIKSVVKWQLFHNLKVDCCYPRTDWYHKTKQPKRSKNCVADGQALAIISEELNMRKTVECV